MTIIERKHKIARIEVACGEDNPSLMKVVEMLIRYKNSLTVMVGNPKAEILLFERGEWRAIGEWKGSGLYMQEDSLINEIINLL